jgi:hypothetical protein
MKEVLKLKNGKAKDILLKLYDFITMTQMSLGLILQFVILNKLKMGN